MECLFKQLNRVGGEGLIYRRERTYSCGGDVFVDSQINAGEEGGWAARSDDGPKYTQQALAAAETACNLR
jgi:hypothetical protein